MLGNSQTKNNESGAYDDIFFDLTNPSVQLEALRHIKTNIMFGIPKKSDGAANIIAIASVSRIDGKSEVASSLATVFAQSGCRVLFLDCDLREHAGNGLLEPAGGAGISDYLCKDAKLSEIIVKTTQENLDYIACGKLVSNANELLLLPAFGGMLTELAKNYDYIFIDTSPLGSVSDGFVVATNADGVLIVVRQSKTSHMLISDAVKQLEFIKAKIFGFVVTDYKLSDYNKKR